MRLMTASAQLMSSGRGGRLLPVAVLARRRRGDAAAVRLVTADTLLVARVHLARGRRVARRANRAADAWIVRQPAMATFTSGVPNAQGGQRELFLMTALTSGVLRELELEVMRRVTALARRAVVKRVVRRGLAMAAAAAAGDGCRLNALRMHVVAGEAASQASALRVIRVNVPVTIFAGRKGALFDVVRLMTTHALRVLRHLCFGEHEHGGVAGATWNGLFCRKIVRHMAAHTRAVPTRKQRRRGHDGQDLAVAVGTSGEGIRRGRVLMRVARLTSLVRRFAQRGVARRDSAVAAHARR